MNKPWMVVAYTKEGFLIPIIMDRFIMRTEAEMYRQRLNRLTDGFVYRVIFDDKAVLIA